MIDNLLKSGLYEVETRVPASKSGTIEKLYIRYLPQPQNCPKCGSPKIIKKTLSRRVIIDIQGNQPIEVTITKQRYKCQCGKTFIMKDESDYPERIHISKDASDLLGTMLLEEPDLTVIARGYLFHNQDGSLRGGNPYERVEYAQKALCAWCSIPDKNEDEPFTNFGALASDFPELVNAKGEGWYYRHVQNIVKFVKKNPDAVSEKAKTTTALIAKGFKTEWKKKVRQLQVPIFALNTKAAWALRFDDILADALELGALRTEEYILPPEKENTINALDLCSVPFEVVCDVIAYCEANKPTDTDWVVLPIANFDCYYGNTNFSKKWLSKIPTTILSREVSNGVSRVKLNI